jgi:hypothetical protein
MSNREAPRPRLRGTTFAEKTKETSSFELALGCGPADAAARAESTLKGRGRMAMKRFIFTTLMTIASAAGAALAARAVEAAWRKARHERPPAQSRWAQLLVGFSLSRPIARLLGTSRA